MAQLATSPISPKMFRHFAVITIVITVLLAVFADGENREALAENVSDEIAERQEASRVQDAQVAKFGKPKLIARSAPRSSRGGYDGGNGFDPDYGSPMDRTGHSTNGGGVPRARIAPSAKMPASYAPYGIPQAQWNAMSEQEREEFLRTRRAPPPPVSAEQHQREVADLLAASAARAGEAGDEGD